MQQFPEHHGDLGGINTVRTEDRAATTFSTLVGVHEPLLEHSDGHLPSTSHFTQYFATDSELIPINRPEQLGPQDRHVFGIAGPQEEVALVRACPAADTAIHENLQRPELV